MKDDPVAIARAAYEAYERKDRTAIEELTAEDFHFSSPLDNRLDRETYFSRCWPNSQTIAAFEASSHENVAFTQFDRVRILALRGNRASALVGSRSPRVGDIATVVEVYNHSPGYELECATRQRKRSGLNRSPTTKFRWSSRANCKDSGAPWFDESVAGRTMTASVAPPGRLAGARRFAQQRCFVNSSSSAIS